MVDDQHGGSGANGRNEPGEEGQKQQARRIAWTFLYAKKKPSPQRLRSFRFPTNVE
jgi:hypothetical protein